MYTLNICCECAQVGLFVMCFHLTMFFLHGITLDLWTNKKIPHVWLCLEKEKSNANVASRN